MGPFEIYTFNGEAWGSLFPLCWWWDICSFAPCPEPPSHRHPSAFTFPGCHMWGCFPHPASRAALWTSNTDAFSPSWAQTLHWLLPLPLASGVHPHLTGARAPAGCLPLSMLTHTMFCTALPSVRPTWALMPCSPWIPSSPCWALAPGAWPLWLVSYFTHCWCLPCSALSNSFWTKRRGETRRGGKGQGRLEMAFDRAYSGQATNSGPSFIIPFCFHGCPFLKRFEHSVNISIFCAFLRVLERHVLCKQLFSMIPQASSSMFLALQSTCIALQKMWKVNPSNS